MITHPLILFALIPLGILALMLLTRRSASTRVPFVALWQDLDAASPRVGRRSLPPWAIVLLLASAFVAIFAAADIRLPIRSTGRGGVTVLIDAYSPRSRSVDWSATLTRVKAVLSGFDRISLRSSSRAIDVPVAEIIFPPRQVEGSVGFAEELGSALRETDDVILAVTVDAPAIRSDRLAVLSVSNDGPRIEQAAARVGEMMVSVANVHADVTLVVRTDEGKIERRLTAVSGERQTLFLETPTRTSRQISLELAKPPNARVDRVLLTRRGGAMPRRVGNLPAAMGRMIDAYIESQPADSSADVFRVASNVDDLGGGAGAVCAAARREMSSATPIVSAHDITRNIRWPKSAMAVALPPGDGWRPLVSFDGVPAVAIRETPARQVFVGVSGDAFEASAAFVILWANTFEWLGGEPTFLLDDPHAAAKSPAFDDLRALDAARSAVIGRRPSLVGPLCAIAVSLVAAALIASSATRRRGPIPVDTRQ